jgi:hypothetical protein
MKLIIFLLFQFLEQWNNPHQVAPAPPQPAPPDYYYEDAPSEDYYYEADYGGYVEEADGSTVDVIVEGGRVVRNTICICCGQSKRAYKKRMLYVEKKVGRRLLLVVIKEY